MLTEVAQPQQQAIESIARAHQRATPRRSTSEPHSTTAPQQSHLQAAHATRHGVILRGTHHDTFWEWRT
jgi:hypothetical protein